MDIWSTIEYVYIYYFEFDIVNFEYGLQHFYLIQKAKP